MMHSDTTDQADCRYHELPRAMTPAQRFDAAARLTQAVRELAIAGIRARHPDAGADEVTTRSAVRLYGREIAARLFTAIPDDAV